jgi:hypothetical protein
VCNYKKGVKTLERRDVLKLGVTSLAVLSLPSAVLAVVNPITPHELMDLKDLMSGTCEWLSTNDWHYQGPYKSSKGETDLVKLVIDPYVFEVSRCNKEGRCSYLTQVRKTHPERPTRQVSSYIAFWRHGTDSRKVRQALSKQLKRSYIWLASDQGVV